MWRIALRRTLFRAYPHGWSQRNLDSPPDSIGGCGWVGERFGVHEIGADLEPQHRGDAESDGGGPGLACRLGVANEVLPSDRIE